MKRKALVLLVACFGLLVAGMVSVACSKATECECCKVGGGGCYDKTLTDGSSCLDLNNSNRDYYCSEK